MVWLEFIYLFPFRLYIWRTLFILRWLYYSLKHIAWGYDMINRITSLKYRLNVHCMSISSKYGFQTGWIICVTACTTTINLNTFCFSAHPVCSVVRCLVSQVLLEFWFSVSSCKRSCYGEVIFPVAGVTVLYYSGQALQNGFYPLNATNIC